MKVRFIHIAILTLVLLLSSCSSDDDGIDTSQVFGVWDRIEMSQNQTTLFRIVFGTNANAIKIDRTDFDDGTSLSSAGSYKWELIADDEVRLVNEANGDILIFEINTNTSPPQLESETNTPLIKTSEDFTDFF